MMKSKTKEILKNILPFAVFVLVFALIVSSVFIYFETHKNRKNPLEWCLVNIHEQENYNCDWTYVYQEVETESGTEQDTNFYRYYITVFTSDRIGEWYCFVECCHKNWFDTFLDVSVYTFEEVHLIDCNIIREAAKEN